MNNGLQDKKIDNDGLKSTRWFNEGKGFPFFVSPGKDFFPSCQEKKGSTEPQQAPTQK